MTTRPVAIEAGDRAGRADGAQGSPRRSLDDVLRDTIAEARRELAPAPDLVSS
ncbi:MAG TPA: hypothetical protein VFU43_09005 [Streptosporangiaceae bacterium]|nr:hypothetical protein [Streptosporangiaceae bacterium]